MAKILMNSWNNPLLVRDTKVIPSKKYISLSTTLSSFNKESHSCMVFLAIRKSLNVGNCINLYFFFVGFSLIYVLNA